MPDQDRMGAAGVMTTVAQAILITDTDTDESVLNLEKALGMMTLEGRAFLVTTLLTTVRAVEAFG